MSSVQTTIRFPPLVVDLLGQLAALRGVSRSTIIVSGILAQAEQLGLIASGAAVLTQLKPDPLTDPERQERKRLSQQRSRARKQGKKVPKLKRGRPVGS